MTRSSGQLRAALGWIDSESGELRNRHNIILCWEIRFRVSSRWDSAFIFLTGNQFTPLQGPGSPLPLASLWESFLKDFCAFGNVLYQCNFRREQHFWSYQLVTLCYENFNESSPYDFVAFDWKLKLEVWKYRSKPSHFYTCVHMQQWTHTTEFGRQIADQLYRERLQVLWMLCTFCFWSMSLLWNSHMLYIFVSICRQWRAVEKGQGIWST